MNNVKFKGNKLFIGKKELSFAEDIYQVEQDGDEIYVLLDIPMKEELTYDDFHNIYCFSVEGIKLWQIGVRPKGDKAVYTMIKFKNSILYVNDFLGRRYIVDRGTGEIKDMSVVK